MLVYSTGLGVGMYIWTRSYHNSQLKGAPALLVFTTDKFTDLVDRLPFVTHTQLPQLVNSYTLIFLFFSERFPSAWNDQ